MTTRNTTVCSPLSDDKILALSKMEALADDDFIVSQKVQFLVKRVEIIVGKGENACYKYFLLFQQCFQKVFRRGAESLHCGLQGLA